MLTINKALAIQRQKQPTEGCQVSLLDVLNIDANIPLKPSRSEVLNKIQSNLNQCCTQGFRLRCKEYDCSNRVFYQNRITCDIPICPNPRCISHRYQMKLRKYQAYCQLFEFAQFLTVTFKGYTDSIDQSHHNLINDSWRKLSKFLRQHGVIRYIKFIEPVENEYFDRLNNPVPVWYFHIHTIIEPSRWVDISELRKFWHDLTGSNQVWIETVTNLNQLTYYVAAYCSSLSFLNMPITQYLNIRKMKFYYFWQHPKFKKKPQIPKFSLTCAICESPFIYDAIYYANNLTYSGFSILPPET